MQKEGNNTGTENSDIQTTEKQQIKESMRPRSSYLKRPVKWVNIQLVLSGKRENKREDSQY